MSRLPLSLRYTFVSHSRLWPLASCTIQVWDLSFSSNRIDRLGRTLHTFLKKLGRNIGQISFKFIYLDTVKERLRFIGGSSSKVFLDLTRSQFPRLFKYTPQSQRSHQLNLHSYKQLRHRIQQVWKKVACTSTRLTTECSINNREEEIQADSDAVQHGERESDSRILFTPPNPFPSKETTFEIQSQSLNVSPIMRGLEGIIDCTSNSDQLVTPVLSAGMKRRGRSADWDNESARKRQNEGNSTKEVIATMVPEDVELVGPPLTSHSNVNLTSPQHSPPSTTSKASETYPEDNLNCPEASQNHIPADNHSSHTHTSISFSPAGIRDPVWTPCDLQGLLSHIGIEWDLDCVTRLLQKDVVFRTVTMPAVAHSNEQMNKVKAFVEYMFASSNLEQAFQLFLLAWIMLRKARTMPRYEIEYTEAKLLIQCARSADQIYERRLVMAMLEQELSLLDTKSPQSTLMHSSLSLETRLHTATESQSWQRLILYSREFQMPSSGVAPEHLW